MYKIDIKCPKCNKKNRVKVYESIGDDKINLLLNDSLFKIECNECKETIRVDYPLVFENDNYIVSYLKKEIKTKKKYRYTENYNDFKEKVMIFNDDLNDVLIEFLKDYIRDEMKLQNQIIRYNNMDEKNIVFSIVEDNQIVGLSIDFYESIKKKARLKENSIIDDKNYLKYMKI